MSLMRRLGYYLGGFSIGLILLAFFLSGKRTSCDYGPEARVLKNIRTKTPAYQAALLDAISNGIHFPNLVTFECGIVHEMSVQPKSFPNTNPKLTVLQP